MISLLKIMQYTDSNNDIERKPTRQKPLGGSNKTTQATRQQKWDFDNDKVTTTSTKRQPQWQNDHYNYNEATTATKKKTATTKRQLQR